MEKQATETTELETTKIVNEDGLFDRLLERVKEALPDFLKPQPESAFSVQKDLNGKWRWVASFSNNFIDREKEILSDTFWDKYLGRLDLGLVPMPELWAAHIPETKHGQADMVFAVGNFIVATGTFDDTPEAAKATEYYRKHGAKVQLSHGFTFPKWAFKDGVYDDGNPFEITTLPPPLVGSNPFTDLEVNQSMKQITSDQQAALAQLFGKEYVEKLVTSREAQSKELIEAGVAYKDFAEVSTPTEEVKPAEGEKPQVVDSNILAQLFSDLMEGQGEILAALTAQGKAYKAIEAARAADKQAQEKRLAALETENKELRAELKLSPRASEAAETKLTDAEAEAVKKQIDAAEADPFYS